MSLITLGELVRACMIARDQQAGNANHCWTGACEDQVICPTGTDPAVACHYALRAHKLHIRANAAGRASQLGIAAKPDLHGPTVVTNNLSDFHVPCHWLRRLDPAPNMATSKTPTPKPPAGDSAAGRHQPVDALLHTADERLFIPSREEAGQEDEALAGRPLSKPVPLNPVTTRGQDPELYWLHKYGADDADQRLRIDIRSLYRHEHIEPERLIARLYALKSREATRRTSCSPMNCTATRWPSTSWTSPPATTSGMTPGATA